MATATFKFTIRIEPNNNVSIPFFSFPCWRHNCNVTHNRFERFLGGTWRACTVCCLYTICVKLWRWTVQPESILPSCTPTALSFPLRCGIPIVGQSHMPTLRRNTCLRCSENKGATQLRRTTWPLLRSCRTLWVPPAVKCYCAGRYLTLRCATPKIMW